MALVFRVFATPPYISHLELFRFLYMNPQIRVSLKFCSQGFSRALFLLSSLPSDLKKLIDAVFEISAPIASSSRSFSRPPDPLHIRPKPQVCRAFPSTLQCCPNYFFGTPSFHRRGFCPFLHEGVVPSFPVFSVVRLG